MTAIRRALASRRAWIGVAVAAVIGLVLLSRGLHDALLRLLATAHLLASSHPLAAVLLVLVFSALSAMLVFVSSAAITPFLVYTWGTLGAFLLLWTGWLLGGILSYGIGRILGRPVVDRLASPKLLERYEHWVSDRMSFPLVLLFQLGLPSELPGYLLGLVGYSLGRYVAALALAELPYGIATVLLGAGLIDRRVELLIPVGAAAAVLAIWSFLALHRRLGREGGTPPGAARA